MTINKIINLKEYREQIYINLKKQQRQISKVNFPPLDFVKNIDVNTPNLWASPLGVQSHLFLPKKRK